MKRVLLLCCFTFLLLCSCSIQTEEDIAALDTEITVRPSPYADEVSCAGLTEQELFGMLFTSGAEAIPDDYAVIEYQEQADDMSFSVVLAQTGDEDHNKIFLQIEQNNSTTVYPIETTVTFETVAIAVSRLDELPVVGIAGKSDDTLFLYFYAIRDGSMEDYFPVNWNIPEDRVTVEGNRIMIPGARELKAYPGKTPILFQIESGTEYCFAVIHSYEFYTNEKNFTLRFIPGSWALRMTEEQYSVLYDTYDAYPFDESISLILEQNTEILAQKPWRLPLPEGYEYFDMCKGDLNGDGLDDIAVVIEQRPGMSGGSRTIYIMLACEDGSLAVCWQSGTHLMGRGEGGVFGDPYCGIIIHNGELIISHYGGSSDRWGFTFKYAIQKGELILTHFSDFSHSTHTACGTRTTYDVMAGIIEKRSETYEGDLYDGLLLSACAVEPEQTFLFTGESHGQWDFSLPDINSTNPPLPSLYCVQYGEQVWKGLDGWKWKEPLLSASQALDIVMSSLYPSSMKHTYPYPEDIMDNYKRLLCYDVPSYYYTDGNTTLTYHEQTVWNGELYHYILVQTPDDTWGKEIRVSDLTGAIE